MLRASRCIVGDAECAGQVPGSRRSKAELNGHVEGWVGLPGVSVPCASILKREVAGYRDGAKGYSKLPVFITVTVWVNPLVVPTIWGSKVTPTGVVLTVLVDAVPVPESVTVRGLPGALSVIVIVPVRAPPAVGVKVTLIWQLVAGAKCRPGYSRSTC